MGIINNIFLQRAPSNTPPPVLVQHWLTAEGHLVTCTAETSTSTVKVQNCVIKIVPIYLFPSVIICNIIIFVIPQSITCPLGLLQPLLLAPLPPIYAVIKSFSFISLMFTPPHGTKEVYCLFTRHAINVVLKCHTNGFNYL